MPLRPAFRLGRPARLPRLPRLPRVRAVLPVLPRQAPDRWLDYAPHPDGRPDPGEVVWAWVPYEDDPSRGKDRPVLLVGREGETLLGLALTSKDHDVDASQEAREGRHWMDVGTGPWDDRRRASEVRLDRLLRLDPADVRREGAVLPRDVFDAVVAAAQQYW